MAHQHQHLHQHSSSTSSVTSSSHGGAMVPSQAMMPQIPSGFDYQQEKCRRKPTNVGPLMCLEQQQKSQRELWELFQKPSDWTLAKFYLIQQLQAFLIEIFRRFVTPDRPCLREAELFAFVKQHIHRLIRRNGTCYTGRDDMEKTITGTLYGSKLFEKDVMMGTWTINAEKALVWENAMLERIEAKKPWLNRNTIDISNPSTGQTNQLIPANNMNFLNKTPVYQKPGFANQMPSQAPMHQQHFQGLVAPQTQISNQQPPYASHAGDQPPEASSNHLSAANGVFDTDTFLVQDSGQAGVKKPRSATKQVGQAVASVKLEDESHHAQAPGLETAPQVSLTNSTKAPLAEQQSNGLLSASGTQQQALANPSPLTNSQLSGNNGPQSKHQLLKPATPKTPSKAGKAAQQSTTSSSTLGKRTHREVIEDFESVYLTYKRQKRSQAQAANKQQQQKLQQPQQRQSLGPSNQLMQKLDQFCAEGREPVDLGAMLKEFGSERLIGMLHAFVLLKPVLSKSLRDKEESIVKESNLRQFDRLKQVAVSLDANEVQERLDELHESLDDACSSFNRTLLAMQQKIDAQEKQLKALKQAKEEGQSGEASASAEQAAADQSAEKEKETVADLKA